MVIFLHRSEYYDVTTNEMGETHVRIAKHRNGALYTVKLKALMYIQKFVEPDESGLGSMGNWKSKENEKNAKLFINTASRMNDLPFSEDEETPF